MNRIEKVNVCEISKIFDKKLPNFIVKVCNKEECDFVQEIAFKYGFGWMSCGKNNFDVFKLNGDVFWLIFSLLETGSIHYSHTQNFIGWENYVEFELIPEDNTFKSQQEIFEYLYSGGVVGDLNSPKYCKFVNGSLKIFIDGNEINSTNIGSFSQFKCYYKIIEGKKWYESIPRGGIKCNIDFTESSYKMVTNIVRYENGKLYSATGNWYNLEIVTPITEK